MSRNLAFESLDKLRCPVTFGFDRNGFTRLIYCGQWSCPDCAKKLAKRWAVRIKLHIQKDTQDYALKWYMLTLTLGRGHSDPQLAYKALRKLWNRLRMAINRFDDSRKWQYAAFVEGQPKRQNMPHFHIIMDNQPPCKRNKKGEITKHALHDWAHRMGWGFEADLGQVDHDKAASYVAKYVSKGSGVVPPGFRRVRVSHGWTKLPKDPERKLLVLQKAESIVDFILRVGDRTSVEYSILVDRYFDGKTKLELANLDKE